MKAVMYGAGNIGRGFIGQKLYQSGYHTTFIDVNRAVVDEINAKHEYPIYITRGTEYVPEWVKNVDAVDGKDADAVVDAIANTDLLCDLFLVCSHSAGGGCECISSNPGVVVCRRVGV